MTTPSDTLSVASINLILFAASQLGADTKALARSIDISPEQLRDPDGRVEVRQVQALWREVTAATGDPNIALKLGEMINPVAFGVLSYVMMHSPTLGKAFEKLCQYQDIVCEGIRTTGRRSGHSFTLSLEITSSAIIYLDHTLNSELSIYLAAIRALIGYPVNATEIRFSYPHPADIREHSRVFAPARLTFDAPQTEMILDAALLDLPVLNASPSLSILFEKHAADILNRLKAPSLTTRVKSKIVTIMKGEEPTLATVADQLAMGVRTLQLHLKEEGTTYQQLLDEIRKELAVKHLQEANLSTTDIAYLLGFAEPSVFFRSFKKWTGQTPGAYRLAQA
ncbi:AraC family transcriptional regulator [Spirosoma endophyticum]|uniref:Helix-turn-helix domain-containing protein n=1 Tax=Spirosoma endophyticum TaxID=662367 RepID=A0A1I1U8C0_9BACT|nr:AraC family transcriptional regulator [Spirosoma endophyticum]SFD64150.1 Helix-turn-helix domain-containing protein [Spirosoma endophyticum]